MVEGHWDKPGKTRIFEYLKIQKSRHKAHGRKSCRRDNSHQIPVSGQKRTLRIHSNKTLKIIQLFTYTTTICHNFMTSENDWSL